MLNNPYEKKSISKTAARIQLPIEKISSDKIIRCLDFIAAEEALQIILEYGDFTKRIRNNLAFLMRSPGDDCALVTGFLFSEGVINAYADIEQMQLNNDRVVVMLKPSVKPQLEQSKRFMTSASSCGICGKSSDPLGHNIYAEQRPNPHLFAASIFYNLPKKMRQEQAIFEQTGALHASALFDDRATLLDIREDIGRHNATDKIIGAQLQKISYLANTVLLQSGRVSVEIIQKCARAFIPVVAAIGAPSSLAIKIAEQTGITLIGFLNDKNFNLYSGGHRIVSKK